MINKWDRPGLDPLGLMDRSSSRSACGPTPLTWPVGVAGDFRGVLDRRTGELHRLHPHRRRRDPAPEKRMDATAAAGGRGRAVGRRRGGATSCSSLDGADHDQEPLPGRSTTPVLFASALLNFGVAQLLDILVDLAPPPGPTPAVDGSVREVDDDFSAFVFKVQAGMDTTHRDRLAFARVCSGVFERGMVATHAATGRPFATKYAQAVFGRERAVGRGRLPGDIIGLVNANALRVGDTIYVGRR